MNALAPGRDTDTPGGPAGIGGSGPADRRRERGQVLAVRAAAGLGIVAAWQVCAMALAPHYIARPLGILAQVPAVLGNQSFWSAAGSTLLAVAEGLIIAVVIGTAAGLVMGRLRDVDRAMRLYVDSFYAMPLVALIPLLTVWFGYTSAARLVVVVIEAMLPVIFSVAEGGRSLPAEFTDVARAYRAPWWRVWAGIVLPASLPYLLGGIDLAIGRALVGAVVAEFIASLNGLGYYILFNVRSFAEDKAMVALVVLVMFALAVRGFVSLFVRRRLPWYRDEASR
ncbi:MAG: ABC transporter permease subunit [Streptosporangiales bacterium]|nr:ABC transporter permease subunit [Streptosporangiales bacterium]